MNVCWSNFLKLIGTPPDVLLTSSLGPHAYSLRDPRVRPRTSCFWTSKMKMKLGITAVVPTAAMNPHSEPVEVTKVVILTGSVRIELVRNSDRRKSVHEKMKQRTAVAATPTFPISTP